ncbi:MAG: ATP-binding protein [Candidatus Obscuribacterales bacterium]
MKHRLTRKLLLILAIPLTFELALFSTCALMLNTAEAERLNETSTISMIASMSPVLASTIRNLSLAVHSRFTDRITENKEVEIERKDSRDRIERFSATRIEHPEFKQEIESICQGATTIIGLLDNFSGQTIEPAVFLELRESARNIDSASRTILEDLQARRTELKKNDAEIRNFFRNFLWFSLAMSLLVALLGLIAFRRLLSHPLAELTRLSYVLAEGGSVEVKSRSDDEIGDLARSFENMAAQLEAKRRIEKAILQNTSDLICTIDKENRLASINTAAEKILGFTPASLVKKGILEILQEDAGESTIKHLDDIRQSGSFGSFEARLRRANGTIIDTTWSVRCSERDQLLYCSVHDVDFERKTEILSRDLRVLVTEELKQKLDLARSIFSDSSEKTGPLKESFDTTIALLDKLRTAIAEESPDLATNREKHRVRDLIDASVASVEALALARAIEISSIVEENPELSVDPVAIKRVLTNLLSNAIKVSPDQGVILVRATASGDQARFEVSDSGPGIAPNMQHLLFERFSQLGRAESAEGKGSGLGLYGARKIVENHSGAMGLISDGKSGTTVWFSLPVKA